MGDHYRDMSKYLICLFFCRVYSVNACTERPLRLQHPLLEPLNARSHPSFLFFFPIEESETELAAERGSTESDTALPDDLPEEPETAFNSDQSDRRVATSDTLGRQVAASKACAMGASTWRF